MKLDLESRKINASEQLFSTATKTDTRKTLNRNSKVTISKEILNDIENNGITSEQLEELIGKYKLNVFFYKGQITVHGDFDKLLDNNYIYSYKFLIKNKNKSLGIKYTAIDLKKKQQLSTYFNFLDIIGTRFNSSEYHYIKQKYTTRETYMEDAKEYIKLSKQVNTLFEKNNIIGNSEVKILNYYGTLILDISIYLQRGFAKDIKKFFFDFTGKTYEEMDVLIEEKRKADEAKAEAGRIANEERIKNTAEINKPRLDERVANDKNKQIRTFKELADKQDKIIYIIGLSKYSGTINRQFYDFIYIKSKDVYYLKSIGSGDVKQDRKLNHIVTGWGTEKIDAKKFGELTKDKYCFIEQFKNK